LVDPISEENVDLLEQMGFEGMIVLRYPPPNPIALADFGGVNAVAYDSQTGVFTGVGDPRRYGSAMGPRVVPVRD
jgi:gamma-glutamyltranspeptidase